MRPAYSPPVSRLTFWEESLVKMGAKKVLVVDDDPGVRASLAAVLPEEGFEVAVIASSREAMESWGGMVPDALVLDSVAMELAEWIRRMKAFVSPQMRPMSTVLGAAGMDRCTRHEGTSESWDLTNTTSIGTATGSPVSPES